MTITLAAVRLTDDPCCVEIQAQTGDGRQIAGRLRLCGLSPGAHTIGIGADGAIGVDLEDPAWSVDANIPAGMTAVTVAVVPLLAGG